MGVFGRIILPLSKPIIAVVSIFTVTSAWGDFLLPYLILTDRNKQTVMLQIYNLQTSSYSSPVDQLLVAIVFAIIPPIIIFFFFQRFIMGGATVGGVKE
jgi:multiple sugar transport system permease protein